MVKAPVVANAGVVEMPPEAIRIARIPDKTNLTNDELDLDLCTNKVYQR
jgi:hypothetical protein